MEYVVKAYTTLVMEIGRMCSRKWMFWMSAAYDDLWMLTFAWFLEGCSWPCDSRALGSFCAVISNHLQAHGHKAEDKEDIL